MRGSLKAVLVGIAALGCFASGCATGGVIARLTADGSPPEFEVIGGRVSLTDCEYRGLDVGEGYTVPITGTAKKLRIDGRRVELRERYQIMEGYLHTVDYGAVRILFRRKALGQECILIMSPDQLGRLRRRRPR